MLGVTASLRQNLGVHSKQTQTLQCSMPYPHIPLQEKPFSIDNLTNLTTQTGLALKNSAPWDAERLRVQVRRTVTASSSARARGDHPPTPGAMMPKEHHSLSSPRVGAALVPAVVQVGQPPSPRTVAGWILRHPDTLTDRSHTEKR
jgi:hypothetical protein